MVFVCLFIVFHETKQNKKGSLREESIVQARKGSLSSTMGRKRSKNKESKTLEDGSERKGNQGATLMSSLVTKASKQDPTKRTSERNRRIESDVQASNTARKSDPIEGTLAGLDARDVNETERRDARLRSDFGSEQMLRRASVLPPVRLVSDTNEKRTFPSPSDPLSTMARPSVLGDHEGSFPKEGEQFLLQLPYRIPLIDGQETSCGIVDSGSNGTSPLDLPRGRLGELLMYDNGDVELQIGHVSYLLVPGVPTEHRQELVIVREDPTRCDSDEIVRMGEAERTYLVVPNVPSRLD